jgi:uncharacterized GH25 family protein
VLIQSTPKPNDTLYRTVVGHTFELVPLENPFTQILGSWLPVQVFFRGKPLANKVITARNRIGNQPAIHQYARTDSQGRCSFKLERAGQWFIHATHMVPAANTQKADWESFWTTFSFGMAEGE